jgi:hypothetical protein
MKATHHAWLFSTSAQETLYRSPNIDFITIHSYHGATDQEGDNRVYDDAALAGRLQMPFIVEEAGFDAACYPERPAQYRAHMERWLGLGASGYMPWGFMTDRATGDGDSSVGVGCDHADFPRLVELFREYAPKFAASAAAIPPEPAGYDGARYGAGSDLVKDGTPVHGGQPFRQSWTMYNAGTRPWPAGYRLAWVSGGRFGAPAEVPVGACEPGLAVPIGVPRVAPAAPGLYRSAWRMRNPQGQPFGDPIWTAIEVVADAIPVRPLPQ